MIRYPDPPLDGARPHQLSDFAQSALANRPPWREDHFSQYGAAGAYADDERKAMLARAAAGELASAGLMAAVAARHTARGVGFFAPAVESSVVQRPLLTGAGRC